MRKKIDGENGTSLTRVEQIIGTPNPEPLPLERITDLGRLFELRDEEFASIKAKTGIDLHDTSNEKINEQIFTEASRRWGHEAAQEYLAKFSKAVKICERIVTLIRANREFAKTINIDEAHEEKIKAMTLSWWDKIRLWQKTT